MALVAFLKDPCQVGKVLGKTNSASLYLKADKTLVQDAPQQISRRAIQMSRMLIGETQEDLAIAMRDWFSWDHYTVEIQRNGLRVLECLRQYQYDVIVLEIALLGLDGISVVRDYRAGGGNTPIA